MDFGSYIVDYVFTCCDFDITGVGAYKRYIDIVVDVDLVEIGEFANLCHDWTDGKRGFLAR